MMPPCNHEGGPVVSVVGHGTPSWVRQQLGYNPTIHQYRAAMGINWMNRDELSEAIPPAYTEFIGGQLLDHLGRAFSLTAPGAFRPRLGVVNRGARSHDFAVTRADTPTP
jgi:hypothetical protein